MGDQINFIATHTSYGRIVHFRFTYGAKFAQCIVLDSRSVSADAPTAGAREVHYLPFSDPLISSKPLMNLANTCSVGPRSNPMNSAPGPDLFGGASLEECINKRTIFLCSSVQIPYSLVPIPR